MKTRQIYIGNVPVGGGAPLSIQSMTNTRTEDAEATLAQIRELAAAGCQIIRSAVPSHSVLPSFERICAESPLPVVADIHFDHTLAIESLKLGAACVRVNPGNLRKEEYARDVARTAAALGKPVRIGVNCGSLAAEARERYGRTARALVESARYYIRLFEEEGCTQLKVSLKSSDVRMTVEACRLFSQEFDIPLHLGVTEAGPISCGIIKSAVGIGALLLEGIGDTFRVSLTAPPVEEIKAARKILEALGLRQAEPEIISCPTCGRTHGNLLELVSRVEAEIERRKALGATVKVRRIAVMGCEVNGPGEASDADVGIASTRTGAILFRKGQPVAKLSREEIIPVLMQEIM